MAGGRRSRFAVSRPVRSPNSRARWRGQTWRAWCGVTRSPCHRSLTARSGFALLGPLSGGSINPARQFGPAALSGQTSDLWICLIAPIRLRMNGAAM
ncbi:aquaporin [Streptomyces antimycoticus]|uniref:aquaporin n=1 Tax=Streptomyces antimycoticus TaxID=68175 RepID=UPI0036A515AD